MRNNFEAVPSKPPESAEEKFKREQTEEHRLALERGNEQAKEAAKKRVEKKAANPDETEKVNGAD